MNEYKQLELDLNVNKDIKKNNKFNNISFNLLLNKYNIKLNKPLFNLKNYLKIPSLELDNIILNTNLNIKLKSYLFHSNLISNNFKSILEILDIDTNLNSFSNKNLDDINIDINSYLNKTFDLDNIFNNLSNKQKFELINNILVPKISNLIDYSLSFMEFQNDLKSINNNHFILNKFCKLNNTSIDNVLPILKNDDAEYKFKFFNFKNYDKIIINKNDILKFSIIQDQIFAKNFLFLQNISILLSTIQKEIKKMDIKNKEQFINIIDTTEIKFKKNKTTIGDVKLNIINSLSNSDFVTFLSNTNAAIKTKKINFKN